MGSLISVGENEPGCGCCKINTSPFTLSEDAFIKMKSPAKESEGSSVPEFIGIEIAKGIQSDEYLKLMKCIQDQHSKKVGLSKDAIDDLCNSLSTYTKSINEVAQEEEREVLMYYCVKEMEDNIECNNPVVKYAESVDKYAQTAAETNSRKIRVDTSVFST